MNVWEAAINRRNLLCLGGGLAASVAFEGRAQSGPGEWRARCPICIDCHAHFLVPSVLDIAEAHSPASAFGRRMLPRTLPFMRKMFEPALQIEDMDRRGIDKSVISSAAVIQGLSFARGAQSVNLHRLVNDEAGRWTSAHPERFIASFVLPLDSMDAALQELERAVGMGMKVVNLPSGHDGEYLGASRYADLWSEIENRGLVAFIHPHGTVDPWFQPFAMWNSIGQSIEEVKVMTSLIYEGVMERHPNLKVIMAHGGGYMPHYMGRLDRNAEEKPDTMVNLSMRPSEYLRRFYYDSCVFDQRTLELLVERVGIDRVVLGGDYPVALPDPVGFVAGIPSFSEADIARVAGNNAAALLGLAQPRPETSSASVRDKPRYDT